MFLFSTPPTREAPQADPVVSAIREGAQKTGAGFDYLLKTAQRESALEPDAKAKTSSATGLFQFIEQTWLSMVKREGPKQGLGNFADAITESESGRLTVADPAARDRILELRKNPQVAAVMAGALTQQNRDQLTQAIGRQPHAGELYMAHVLGARGASELIRAASNDPGRVAAKDFPDAAAANRSIFFDKTGRPRSVQEVYGVLAASHANTQLATTAAATAGPASAVGQGAPQPADKPAEIAAALQPGRAKGLIGLFSTEGSREPVSKAVANLWATPRANSERYASLDASDRYFPRQTQNDASPASGGAIRPNNPAAPAEKAPAQPVANVMAPLPPQRPLTLTQPATDPARNPGASAKPRRAPLDLASFMTQRNAR